MNALMRSLMPPPNQKCYPVQKSDWEMFEREFRSLPNDYKDFVNAYGTVVLDDEFFIMTPAGPETENLFALNRQRKSWTERRAGSTTLDLEWFFGLDFLLFCRGGNGEHFGWITIGEPDHWTTFVVSSNPCDSIQTFDHNFSSLMLGILAGTIDSVVSVTPFRRGESPPPPFKYTLPLRGPFNASGD